MTVPSPLFTLASDSGSLLDSALQALRVSEPWQLWLLIFGVLGQAVFFMRWVIQWISSERQGRSHVPEAFWWTSLIGAFMLLIYFTIRREPVGVLGQLTGWMIYARNLHLVHKHRRAGKPVDMPDTAPLEETARPDICPACGQPTPVST